MAIVYYHTMPDQETQRIIASRGDTIQLIDRPAGGYGLPAASYRPESQLTTDPSLVTNDPQIFHSPEFGQAQVRAAQSWFADTAYRNAIDEYQRAVDNYRRNQVENPNAFAPGGILANTPPPKFEDFLQRQQANWNTSDLDFRQAQATYGTPAAYAPSLTNQQQNVVSPTGTAVAGVVKQPQAQPPSRETPREARPTSSQGDWARTAMSGMAVSDWRALNQTAPTVNRSSVNVPRRYGLEELGSPATTSAPAAYAAPNQTGYAGGLAASRSNIIENRLLPTVSGSRPILEDRQQGLPPTNYQSQTQPPRSGGSSITNRLIQELGNASLNYDTWAWHYAQITGRPAPAPEDLGISDRNALLTADQFTSAFRNAGYDPETGAVFGSTPIGGGGGGGLPIGGGGGGGLPIGGGGGGLPIGGGGGGAFPGGYDPYTGAAINEMAQSDRVTAIEHGRALAQDLTAFGNRREGAYDVFTNRLLDTFGDQLGYTPEERELIHPGSRLDRLQWTDADIGLLQLQDAEFNAIANAGRGASGDWSLNERLREGSQGVEEALDAGDVMSRDALDRQEMAMRPWVDERMLRSDQGVRGDMGQTYYDTLGRIRGAIGAPDLRMRQDFASNLAAQDQANSANLERILGQPSLLYDPSVRGNILTDLGQGEAAIRGAIRPDQLRLRAGFPDELTATAAEGGQQALGAIDRARLRYTPDVNARTASTLADSAQRIRGAVDTERLSMDAALPGNVRASLQAGAAGIRGTVDPNRLRASSEFLSRYDWTPEDTERLAEQAGRTVAQRTLADQEALERAAAAEGNTSPMAVAAAKARTRLQGNIAAGDTMTNARIAARQNELAALMGREQVRLGAEQGYSDRAREAETTISGRDLNSLYNTEELRQQAERARAQLQSGAEAEIAARQVQTELEQEGRRLAAEHAATQLETGQINANTANRLNALMSGEQMRVGAEQEATQIQAGQEQQILGRRADTQQRMEEERLKAAQAIARARAEAAASAHARAAENTLAAEQMRLASTQNAARLVADAETSAAERYNQMRLAGEQQRLGAEQFIAQSGLDTERYLGQSRVAAEQANAARRVSARDTQAERAAQAAKFLTQHEADTNRFLATNRQQSFLEGRNQQYTRGMGIYDAQARAGRDIGQTRLAELGQKRKALADRTAESLEAATVTNQQKVGAYGAQQNAQSAATANAIRNYAVPGLGERILGMLGSGGLRKGSELAIVGEAGPELLVDIPRAAKLPSHSLGTVVGGVVDSLRRDGVHGQPYGEPANLEEERTRRNRLWEGLKATVMHPAAPMASSGQAADSFTQNQGGSGLLSRAASFLSSFLPMRSDGGIVSSPPISRVIAPGVEYVNGPQIRTLGENGPEAVVPLTPRPSAKVTPADVPRLLQAYRAGKPLPALGDGKVVDSKKPRGFDWFGLRTLKKAAGVEEEEEKQKEPLAKQPDDTMDVVRESIRKQMESLRMEQEKKEKSQVTAPTTYVNKPAKKGARK